MFYLEKISIRLVVTTIILLNFGMGQPVFAVEKETQVELPEVVIGAQRTKIKQTTDTPIGTFEPKVGTLTVPSNLEAAKIIQRTPGGAAVVDSKAFNNDFSINFEDTLSTVPGVFATKRFAEETRISIRGSGLQRNFHQKGLVALQDGIPFNSADSSGDFQEIDNLTLQRIEVYKGGNGLQFGGTSIGGVINMITKTGQSNPGHELRLEGGSFDTYRGNIQSGFKFNNSDLFLSITGLKSNGFRIHADNESYKFNSNYGIKFSENVETRFYFTVNHIELELPGTVSRSVALNNPESSLTTVSTSNQHRDILSFRFSNKTTFDLGKGKKIDVGAFITDKKLVHPITPFVGIIDQDSNNFGVYAQGYGQYQIGRFKNTFRMGVTTHAGMTDAKVFSNFNLGPRRGALTADTDQTAYNVVVFGENQFFVTPQLALIAGGQVVYAHRDVFNHLTPSETDSDTYESFNPRFGVLYDHTPTLQFFANVTKSFEPPDFTDLTQGGTAGFIELNAQKAWTVEAGIRGQQGIFNWDLTLYRAWLKDEILSFTVGGTIPATGFNAQNTIHQGVEAGLGIVLAENLVSSGDRVKLNNVYTYSDFRFEGDDQFGDNSIAGVPPHVLRSELRYDHQDDWYAALNMDYVSEADVDFSNTFNAPSYTLMGFAAGYEVTKNISTYVTGRNLFDTEYISNFSTAVTATPASNLFYAGDGRSFYGGVTIRFN